MAENFQSDHQCCHKFLITDLLTPNGTANPSAKSLLFRFVIVSRFADLQQVMQKSQKKHSFFLPFTPNGDQAHLFGIFQLSCVAQGSKVDIEMI